MSKRERAASFSARIIAGRYQLTSELARGGMGTVWLATDLKLKRKVAVKIMAGSLVEEAQARVRFQREATSAAGLASAHIVQVFDYGMDEERPYIVMELLTGESLSERLKVRRLLSLAETMEVLTQICAGLRVAHAADLVHRDLKPSNIFLSRKDDRETVKILDFGVVKAKSPMEVGEQTESGLVLGTPNYMSPEQAGASRDIDHRSDLWSVAVIAFRMLAGARPFGGRSVTQVILKLRGKEVPKVTEHRPELPSSADAFFAKAFERDPGSRYQSAIELATGFDALVVAGRDITKADDSEVPTVAMRRQAPERGEINAATDEQHAFPRDEVSGEVQEATLVRRPPPVEEAPDDADGELPTLALSTAATVVRPPRPGGATPDDSELPTMVKPRSATPAKPPSAGVRGTGRAQNSEDTGVSTTVVEANKQARARQLLRKVTVVAIVIAVVGVVLLVMVLAQTP